MGKTNYGVTGKLRGIKEDAVLKGVVGRQIREKLDNIKGDKKSRKTRNQDKKNPARALARIIDDEFEASDSSDYDQIHIGGRIYGKGTDSKKKYKPQKPKDVGPTVKKAMGGVMKARGGTFKGTY
tara:strand:+ start:51 stop:425 length:375 start_codon:yes stop_codon:yes gene_type:complete